MKIINKIAGSLMIMLIAGFVFSSCQKMDTPSLGDYPQDANPPGGPLNFYVAFDGQNTDPLRNAVDSVRANFPSDNPLQFTDGITGKAMQGENKKFIKFIKPNDWAVQAKSFTISFWFKKDGQTRNNTGGNGPEYIFSFKSNNGHWSGSSMLVFLEGSNASTQVKVMIADRNNADKWFEWVGTQSLTGVLNNAWHHMALVYNATESAMTLYVDGVANPNLKIWGGHGDININNNTITEFRIGAGPNDNFDSDDWLSSTFKGSLDQLRLYSVALSAAEVNSLFTGKK